jgi:hypothetical protein
MNVVVSSIASPPAAVSPEERLEVLFEELAELAGQRNAIDGRIVEIVAELDRDGLCGMTGARSLAAVWPKSRGRPRLTRTRSPRLRVGSRNFLSWPRSQRSITKSRDDTTTTRAFET